MFNNKVLMTAVLATAVSATTWAKAEQVPINGTVQSKCIIVTDSAGVYGNPNAYTLSTAATDGGADAIVRIDVTLADAYKAHITAPTEFSSSPSMPDIPTFAGNTEVQTVSDATGMGSYETNKIEQGMTDIYDMTATGSTWFKTESQADYGYGKAFPGGVYRAIVSAECIAI